MISRSCIVGIGGALGFVALAASPALGQASPVAQAREIRASVGVFSMVCGDDYGLSDTAAAPGFAPWDASLTLEAVICDSIHVIDLSIAQRSTMAPGEASFNDGGSPRIRQSAEHDVLRRYVWDRLLVHIPCAHHDCVHGRGRC